MKIVIKSFHFLIQSRCINPHTDSPLHHNIDRTKISIRLNAGMYFIQKMTIYLKKKTKKNSYKDTIFQIFWTVI